MRPHWGLEQRFASVPSDASPAAAPLLAPRFPWSVVDPTRPLPRRPVFDLRFREAPAREPGGSDVSLVDAERESGGEAQLGAGRTGVEASAKVGGAVADPLAPVGAHPRLGLRGE